MSDSRGLPDSGRPRAPTITVDTTAATQKGNLQTTPSSDPNNYLSVPGGRKSRQNSFDSEGETYVLTPSDTSDNGNHRRLPPAESTAELLNHEDALRPDPGTEDEFNVEDNKFAFTPGQLSKLLNPKSLSAFHALGGPAGLEKGLRTDFKSGLSADEQYLDGTVSYDEALSASNQDVETSGPVEPEILDSHTSKDETPKHDEVFADRKRIFKDNRLPERKSKSIFALMWIAYKDKVLILLSIAAAVSLAVGIYQSVQEAKDPNGEAPVEWVEGVAILIAIIIVVVVGSVNDFQKERQFVKLNKKKDERFIKMIRSGRIQEISVYDVLVGDVVLLEPGDLIPVDGIFLEGHNVKCDESSATGESDLLKKTPATEVYHAIETGEHTKKMDPFILSGSKVNEGVGRFVVTGTGVHSTFGKTMMSLRDEGEVTPLQAKLNVLAEYIAKLGLAAAILYFVVVFIEFLVRITSGSEKNLSGPEKGQLFLNIFVTAVSVIVVAVPEGLPLAVTLALAFATTRMLKDNNLVRLLRSCETMGNATTVCSDKTGTLTQNKMTVVAGTLGTSSRFGDNLGLADPEDNQSSLGKKKPNGPGNDVSAQELVSTLSVEVKNLLEQSIVINSTAFEGEDEGKLTFIGSKTETALLSLARDYLGMGQVSVERANVEIAQLFPFDSGRKCMAAVVKISDNKYRMYVKGASEILLSQCSKIIDDPKNGLADRDLTTDQSEMLSGIISAYASRSLRTIAFLYKDFESWPPKGVRRQDDDPNQMVFEDLMKEMTFIGVVGIQDPLREGVEQAVSDCRRAGVFVRMVTGDNVQTAKAIAASCGIYTDGGEVMEGPEFRRLSKAELNRKLPRLQVLARSSPEDKRKLVKHLKEMGETVAVTGDGTNDAPALKTADVGFSMGIAGTEVAKEASAIILMDDNFASIVKALMWGRAVNDAVKKFLQFQITVNITAVIVTFVTGVASSDGTPSLTAVQLLWVNLIMDTFAALALATDPPPPSIIDRKPDRKSAGLISVTMWKMIIGQAIYQIVVTHVLRFAGAGIFGYTTASELEELSTIVFNTFVWMQIFNAFNNRRLDNRFNIFEGIHRNVFFIFIIAIMIGFQIMIVFVGGRALSTTPLKAVQWGYCLVLGFLTIPIGVAIRLIPDEFVLALVPEYFKRKAKPKLVVEDEEQRYDWNPAIQEIRDQLMFLKKYKGGRLNNLRYKVKHPIESGMLPPRPSTGSRSRSSTNNSLPTVTNPGQEQNNGKSQDVPTTPVAQTTTPSRTPNRTPTPDQRAHSRRGRSRSNSAFGPSIAAAGIVAGSIAGWSPVERLGGEISFPPPSHSRSRSDLGKEVHREDEQENPDKRDDS